MRFRQAPPAMRAWIVCLVLAASAVALRRPDLDPREAWALLALVGFSVFEVELGRRAEGGKVATQRPHKGLSAWPFAAVALCATSLAVLVVVPTYAYSRWRGMRVPLFKWVGSGALLVLAATAAQPLLPSLHRPDLLTLPALVLGGAVFLAVEAAAFAVCAVAGEPEDEKWLRAQLRSASFYGNEAFVLCQATVIAVLWSAHPLLVLVLLPSYAVLQRALLHKPLKEAADTDAKTGLLLLHAWEQRAAALLAKGAPFSVVLIDLDHFKKVNDEHGHLVGDDVLKAVADLLRCALRPHDLLGRFGGEEFVLLLPEADATEALAVAERLRAAVDDGLVEGLAMTASFGVYASEPMEPARLREALACADLALYAAKHQGRNVVRSHRPALPVPAQRRETVSRSG